MPVDQNISQQLAALVAVVSVAIIGVAILLISPTWKSFETTYFGLSKSERHNMAKTLSLLFGLFLFFIFITNLIGAYAPSLLRPFGMIFILLLLVICILFSIVSSIVKRKKKDSPSPRLEPLPFMYATTLTWIGFCIFFSSAALFGVAYPMLNIEIGPFNQDNLNWAKWFLVDGIIFLILGVFSYACTHLFQRIQTREQSNDSVKKKSTKWRIVSIAILSCLLLAMILTMPKGLDISDFLSMPLDAKWSVSFTGTQFKITNESDFDWEDVTFSINKWGLSSGYNLSYASLKQGETFAVDAEEFADNEGMRFDPRIMKPIRFSIDVKNPMGRTGTSYVVFDLHVSKYSINTLQSLPLYVDASVSFSGTQFKIANESDFDWEDVTFSINKWGLSSGYSLSHASLKRGETYTINAAEFINDEGVRFNPVTMKPTRFTIEVKNALGQSGIYSGILK